MSRKYSELDKSSGDNREIKTWRCAEKFREIRKFKTNETTEKEKAEN